jgi:hypothetical protein
MARHLILDIFAIEMHAGRVGCPAEKEARTVFGWLQPVPENKNPLLAHESNQAIRERLIDADFPH